jgi:hypothetical protein
MRMTKWYLKLFKRPLKSTVLNSIVACRQVMGRNIQQLSYRIQSGEGLFMKYAHAASKWHVPGHASQNTIPRLTERHFLRKVAPVTEKSKPQRRRIVCSKLGVKKNQCTAATYVTWAFVRRLL